MNFVNFGEEFVMDLVISVCQVLRRDLQELVDTIGEVEPWDEG